MKIGTKIYCIDESVYSGQISKGAEYVIQDVKAGQLRIKTDQDKLAWFPEHCFSFDSDLTIVSINIDDNIENPKNNCVEVTIVFSNGEKRWTTFSTASYLNVLLESNKYLVLPKFIIVNELNDVEINVIITELHKQNKLMEVTLTY